MIKINVSRYGLSAQGHAQFAPAGQDIVCAGVSAVVFGLIRALDERGLITKLYAGNDMVSITAKEAEEAEVMVDMARSSLMGIAEEYPGNVAVINEKSGGK